MTRRILYDSPTRYRAILGTEGGPERIHLGVLHRRGRRPLLYFAVRVGRWQWGTA